MKKAVNRIELTSQVIEIIFSALNLRHIDKASVTEETAIVTEGLNLDSVDILEIIVQLEHRFEIKMNQTESYAEHFRNIGSVVSFVQNKLASA